MNSQISTDDIVNRVVDKYHERSNVGIKKYGTTLEGNNTDDFLQHLQEELMDATLYIEKLQYIVKQLVRDTPNDADLGEKIRKLWT